MNTSHEIHVDLFVIGAGMAGMAAALFASGRGLSVAQAGSVGGIDFSTGLIDLMGVYPAQEKKRWANPWEAIAAAIAHRPSHPYAKLDPADIRTALDEFTGFLGEAGIPFEGYADQNARVLTAMGTAKTTYRIPRSMWPGVLALEEKAPCLLVDFDGLKGYSAVQIQETLAEPWADLKTQRIAFPGATAELYPDHIAWALADPAQREALAAEIAPHVGDARYIGFPAVLGRLDCEKIRTHLGTLLGAEVFEIPTLPPSQAGGRLRAAFDLLLPKRGVRMLSQRRVLGYDTLQGGDLELHIGTDHAEQRVRATNVILAGGRFFGKGLTADRKTVREPVFNLHVRQPESRQGWHREQFLDPRGHGLNQAGLVTDASLRPLDAAGNPALPNLYAAGAILADQDWMREKCGSGLAIATAYKAVQAILAME